MTSKQLELKQLPDAGEDFCIEVKQNRLALRFVDRGLFDDADLI